MKTKSFKKYLEKRLNRDEIAEIKEQAQLEVRILKYKAHLLALMGKEPKDVFKGKK